MRVDTLKKDSLLNFVHYFEVKMAERIVNRALKIIKPVVEELGYIFVDLEYKKEFSGNVLALTIDSEKGITINDCEKVSRALDIPLEERYY